MFIDGLLGGQVARAVVGASFDVADAGRADSVEGLDVLVARFEARVAGAREAVAAGVRETVASTVDLAERFHDGREPMSDARRLATIEMLLRAEKTLAEVGVLLVERAQANELHAAVATPRLLPLLSRMTALVGEEAQLYTEAVRDMRWALLALEAAAEPAADGPVLAGPAELGLFLQGLRAAS